MKLRYYICIDLKSFYASVECVDQGLDPLDTCLVVADKSRSDRTICLAVSPPLKKRGVPSRPRLFEVIRKVDEINALRRSKAPQRSFRGMSHFDSQLRHHPEKALSYIVAMPRMQRYIEMSRDIYGIYLKYISKEDIHVFSIDEVFLDMTGTSYIYPDPVATAHELKDKIRTELGFTVNIGISTNKLLAKMASDFEKPDKVHTLFPEEIPVKMWPLPVRELLFLGRSSEKRLQDAGIRTIGDLAHEKKAKIQALLGEKAGQQLYRYARGLDDSPVKMKPDEAKGFSLETTFNDDLVSMEQALPILLEQCDVLAARMRRKKKKCTCISVTFRTLDFRNKSHQTKLPNATDITEEIYRNAQNLFQESWMRQPLRLLGVSLTGLTDDSFEQLSFFEDTHKKERQQKLDAALDSIRLKYGNDKVTRASIMNSTARIGRKAKAQMENEREQ